MESPKRRHGSSEMAKVPSLYSSRSTRGSPDSPDTANCKPARLLERKPSSKASPSPEKRAVRTSEAQQQLAQVQKELKRVREEKAQALEEVNKMKHALARQMEEDEGLRKIKMLESEVEKAKESEKRMLESLTSQTKQLEGAKIELEEAKLEIRDLRESIRGLEASGSQNTRKLGRFIDMTKSSGLVQSQEDVARLKTELKSAIEAEEKNKKAMDDLAIALKEVTTEMNQLKEQLSAAQSELESVRAEAENSKLELKTTEEKFQVVSEEAERLRLEADESAVAWNVKSNSFIDFVKVSEEEITKLKEENLSFAESLRIAREESTKLRDIMKQALNEATVVKEALEIARRENSQLKDLLSEREDSLNIIKQDYEGLKVSEAAALGSVKELKNLLAAASATEMKSMGSVDTGSLSKPTATVKEGSERNGVAEFPSEQLGSNNLHIENGLENPGSRSRARMASMSERMASTGQKDSTYASLGCVSNLTATALRDLDNGAVNSDDFNHIEGIHFGGINNECSIPAKQKKKKPILRKFGELLRRGGIHK